MSTSIAKDLNRVSHFIQKDGTVVSRTKGQKQVDDTTQTETKEQKKARLLKELSELE